jgi:NAD(P)H dehydrogenase (quinone)
MSSIFVTVSRKLNNFTSYIQPFSDSERLVRRVLLIRAHPVPDSFSAALADATEKGLRSAGHDIRVRSLYLHPNTKLKSYGGATFPPAMTTEERRGYMDPVLIEERQSGNLKLSEELVEAVNDIKWCDSVVFVFPTWWFSLPAILKGYLDRVLLPGVAFRLPDPSLKGAGGTGLISGLTNIKKLGAVTTYGTPWYVVLYCGDSSRSILSNGVRPICAPDCPMVWNALYNMNDSTQSQRDKFLETVEKNYSKF